MGKVAMQLRAKGPNNVFTTRSGNTYTASMGTPDYNAQQYHGSGSTTRTLRHYELDPNRSYAAVGRTSVDGDSFMHMAVKTSYGTERNYEIDCKGNILKGPNLNIPMSSNQLCRDALEIMQNSAWRENVTHTLGDKAKLADFESNLKSRIKGYSDYGNGNRRG